ncbi:MAG: hypothetical protein FJ087_06350 [Deltaproteobacteria bacterium]|nr:hypothetical protein [Deltaproteobacteria bacterium]
MLDRTLLLAVALVPMSARADAAVAGVELRVVDVPMDAEKLDRDAILAALRRFGGIAADDDGRLWVRWPGRRTDPGTLDAALDLALAVAGAA